MFWTAMGKTMAPQNHIWQPHTACTVFARKWRRHKKQFLRRSRGFLSKSCPKLPPIFFVRSFFKTSMRLSTLFFGSFFFVQSIFGQTLTPAEAKEDLLFFRKKMAAWYPGIGYYLPAEIYEKKLGELAEKLTQPIDYQDFYHEIGVIRSILQDGHFGIYHRKNFLPKNTKLLPFQMRTAEGKYWTIFDLTGRFVAAPRHRDHFRRRPAYPRNPRFFDRQLSRRQRWTHPNRRPDADHDRLCRFLRRLVRAARFGPNLFQNHRFERGRVPKNALPDHLGARFDPPETIPESDPTEAQPDF